MAAAADTRTTIVQSRDHLDGLLLELEDRGYGEAAAFDGTTPYLLAACELAGESRWDAFSTHPYATENDPAGLEQPTGLEYELEVEGRWDSDRLRLYGISAEKQYPGLSGLRYPLTVLHPALEGETPYLDEGAADVAATEAPTEASTSRWPEDGYWARGEGIATESPEETAPDPRSVTAVGIPTELLWRFQSEDARFREVFQHHTEPEELWTAAGELEPLQIEILELLAKAPLAGPTDSADRAEVDELPARPKGPDNSAWLEEIESYRRDEESPYSED